MFDGFFNFLVCYPMKKLLSAFCCALCLHTFGTAPSEVTLSSVKSSGEKQLLKALTAIVNREGNKKKPVRKNEVTPSESPWI